MHEYTKAYLESRGIRDTGFRSRKITLAMMERADLILTFEEYMKHDLLHDILQNDSRLDREKLGKKIWTYKAAAGEAGDIPDPYGTSRANYQEVMQEIDRLSQKLVKLWNEKKGGLDAYLR
jgi:protein-tyrosine-phosphatase